MPSIVLAFTLKGQDLAKILAKLQEVRNDFPSALCIHGFLPRAVAVEKGIPLDVINALDANFPDQKNFYWDGKPQRASMAIEACTRESQICVIGEVKEGVAEEVALYSKLGLPIRYYSID